MPTFSDEQIFPVPLQYVRLFDYKQAYKITQRTASKAVPISVQVAAAAPKQANSNSSNSEPKVRTHIVY